MAWSKRRLIIGVVIVIGAFAVWASVVFVQAVLDVPRQAYAVWWTADLVIAYMERHDGAWHRNWEDLRALAEGATEVTEFFRAQWSCNCRIPAQGKRRRITEPRDS